MRIPYRSHSRAVRVLSYSRSSLEHASGHKGLREGLLGQVGCSVNRSIGIRTTRIAHKLMDRWKPHEDIATLMLVLYEFRNGRVVLLLNEGHFSKHSISED
jgi:O-acetyl-ADP-ribose deacetylase (regulator of RNase III)